MIRLLPNPWEGLHPAFPQSPDELPANPPFVVATAFVGSVCGLSAAALRFIFGRPSSGAALRAAAICSVSSAAMVLAAQDFVAWNNIYPFLRKEGLEPKHRVLFRFNRTFSADDAWIAGACMGALLAASSRRFPGAIGWKRYVGGATFGSSLAFQSYILLQHEKLKAASEVWRAQQTAMTKKLVELELQSVREQASQTSTPVQRALLSPSLLQPTPGGTLQSHTQELPVDEGSNYTPGKHPHLPQTDRDEEELEFEPITDYGWSPSSPEEGIKALKEHIRNLLKTRHNLIEEAEYVWHDLARREQLYSDETNAQKKRMQRKALEWLGSVHSHLWSEISSIDWMLADSKKRILQFEAKLSGKQWLPDPPRNAEDMPESVVKRARKHLEAREVLLAMLEELVASGQLSLGDDETETLEEAKLNVEATAALLREYERRSRD